MYLPKAKEVLLVSLFLASFGVLLWFLYLHDHIGTTVYVDQVETIRPRRNEVPRVGINDSSCTYIQGSKEGTPASLHRTTRRKPLKGRVSITEGTDGNHPNGNKTLAALNSSMNGSSSIPRILSYGTKNTTKTSSDPKTSNLDTGIVRRGMSNSPISTIEKVASRSRRKKRCKYTPDTMTPVLGDVLAWTMNPRSDFSSDAVAMPEVFISVKATASVHVSRLSLVTTTWMQTAIPEQIHIVTDTAEDWWTEMAKSFGFNIKVVTNCPTSHTYQGLCCKSGVQFDQYYTAIEQGEKYRWWCQFDDDTYVNLPALVSHLQKFNPEEEKLYMGHYPSRWGKRKFWNGKRKLEEHFPDHINDSGFRYATGASYCISTSLMAELELFLRGTSMAEYCEKLELSDDLAIGAAVDSILGYKLMEVPEMLSHVEDVRVIGDDRLKEMISVGFDCRTRVNVTAAVFTPTEDPSGFLSYHCLLFPDTPWCVRE